MLRQRFKKFLIGLLISLMIFFIGYSYFFRTYMDSDLYLQIAWDYTGNDPHVLNWREPDAEVIWRDGRILVHLTLHTDEDLRRGPYSVYIDPFKKAVVKADPRR